VDRHFITVTALKALADEGKIKASVVAKAIKKFGIDPEKANPLEV
jgi:pyruvate dehydrogenase E1 component